MDIPEHIIIERALAQIHDRLDEQGRLMTRVWEEMQSQLDITLLLDALTPEGCGHENWDEITTAGAPERKYICAEPGCSEMKTEPW